MVQKVTKSGLRIYIGLLLCSLIGITASGILTIDKIRLLENPNFSPTCNLSPIVSCISAISSLQSEILHIPNSLFGLVAFSILAFVSVLLLMRTALPKRIWQLLLCMAVAGFLFVNYLILQSTLVLHVICPWCFTVWLTTPLILFLLSKAYDNTHTPRTDRSWIMKFRLNWGVFLLVLWYVALFFLLLIEFRDYWLSL